MRYEVKKKKNYQKGLRRNIGVNPRQETAIKVDEPQKTSQLLDLGRDKEVGNCSNTEF
jgi:hypothetical protein